MNTVNRRHFLMSSMALPVALKASALPRENNTVRVAVIGFNGRGKAPYLRVSQDAERRDRRALRCRRCRYRERLQDGGSGGEEAAATFKDIRRVLDDRSIDAVSIATPNFHHTLQTIWAVQAGKDVLVEKPVSYNMFEAQQIVAAARKYNRIVQNGTGAQRWLHEAQKKLQDGIIGDVYMARGLCFKWRDTIGHAKEEPASGWRLV
jgi:predicted dehydrogenase